MKLRVLGLAIALGVWSSNASAEVYLTIDGNDYTLTALMENCQAMAGDPAAQVACFNAVSVLLEQQTAEPEPTAFASVPDALEALRAVAQFQDDNSGLIILAEACTAQIVYYANYFHISRRNLSSIDLFSVRLDMSRVDIGQTTAGAGLLSKGVMVPGAVAATIGSEAIESGQNNFAPKSARMTLPEYAIEVTNQLTPRESATFDFALVHPAKRQSSTQIWNAFQAYASACQG